MANNRHTVIPASYVFLEQDGKFLLMRRCNTGYEDGNYQTPAGHVEENETPSQAAIREMKEEIGADIHPNDLYFVHATYRSNTDKTNQRVDFFFKTNNWSGEVTNNEPEKCDDLLWASYDDLPTNTVPHIRSVIEKIRAGEFFSEFL